MPKVVKVFFTSFGRQSKALALKYYTWFKATGCATIGNYAIDTAIDMIDAWMARDFGFLLWVM